MNLLICSITAAYQTLLTIESPLFLCVRFSQSNHFSSTTQKEDTAIANHKPKKFITYRKPKLNTTAKQVSKSLLNTSSSAAHKTFQGLAKHQSETNKTNHWTSPALVDVY